MGLASGPSPDHETKPNSGGAWLGVFSCARVEIVAGAPKDASGGRPTWVDVDVGVSSVKNGGLHSKRRGVVNAARVIDSSP
ncbi:hypothetical protein SLA2020_055450 [Shorea laevis]